MNGSHPAFPRHQTEVDGKPILGLTKREYFAIMAMQGVLAWYANPRIRPEGQTAAIAAADALKLADCLIAELSK